MVRKDLTEKMLERLSKADDEHKEKGSATDQTRLISSWKAATLAEKTLLEDLVHDHHHEWKGTAGKYKAAKYEDLGVFTDKVLREALNNIVKRKKDQLGRRAEMKEEQQTGPFGTSVKAKSNTKASVSGGSSVKSRAHTIKTTKTKKTSKLSYDCDVTVAYGGKSYSNKGKTFSSAGASVKSAAAASVSGVTLNGKPVSSGVGMDMPQPQLPVLMTVVDKPIGGGIAMAQSDGWMDMEANSRNSMRVYVSPLVKLDPSKVIALRTSTQKTHLAILQFTLSKDFTNPSLALGYMVDRIKAEFPDLNDAHCHSLLKLHPRYAAMRNNLTLLLGDKDSFVMEVRVPVFDDRGKPMPISNQLVLAEEDPLFFGYEVQTMDDGGTNLYFEFKAAGKTFRPIKYDFGDVLGSDRTVFPGEVQFPTPSKYREPTIMEVDEDDDDSTIPSDDDDDTEVEAQVLDADDATFDLNNLSVNMMEQLYTKLSDKMNEAAINKMMQKTKGNADSKPSPKKIKRMSGNSSLCGGASCTTRGSADRDMKRKTSKSFDDDDESMAVSTKSTISLTPSQVSKFTSTSKKYK